MSQSPFTIIRNMFRNDKEDVMIGYIELMIFSKNNDYYNMEVYVSTRNDDDCGEMSTRQYLISDVIVNKSRSIQDLDKMTQCILDTLTESFEKISGYYYNDLINCSIPYDSDRFRREFLKYIMLDTKKKRYDYYKEWKENQIKCGNNDYYTGHFNIDIEYGNYIFRQITPD